MFTLLIVLGGILVLYAVGWTPAALLLRRRDLAVAAAPLIGLVLIVLLSQALYDRDLPIRQFAGGLLLLAAAASAAELLFRRRGGEPSPLPVSWILGAGGFAVLLALWPSLLRDPWHFVSYFNFDSFVYQITADRFLDFRLSDPLVLDGHYPGHFFIQWTRTSGHRTGPDILLAFMAAVFGVTTRQAFLVTMTSLLFLMPLAAYLFAALAFDPGRRRMATYLVLASASSLLHLLFYQSLLGHLAGAPLLVALCGCWIALLREFRRDLAVLDGILCAGLLAIYPEALFTLPFLLAPVLIAALVRTRNMAVLRRAGLGLAAAAVGILLLNPLHAWSSFEFLFFFRTTSLTGGSTYAYALTWLGVPAALGVLPLLLPGAMNLLLYWAFVLLGVALAGAAGAWLTKQPGSSSAAVLREMLLGAAVLLLYLALVREYSYGFFKTILLCEFLLQAVFALMIDDVWSNAGAFGGGDARRIAAGLLALLVAGNFLSAVYIGAQSRGPAPQMTDLSFDKLETIGDWIPRGQSVLIDTSDAASQALAMYALRAVPISLSQRLGFWEAWGNPTDLSHGMGADWLLRESGAGDIVSVDKPETASWRTPRFELLRMSDYAAVGANWYARETAGGNAVRWMNNDAEILLANPGERRYMMSFLATTGPSIPGQSRTVRISVNGKPVCEQRLEQRGRIETPLFDVEGPVASIRIATAEKAPASERQPRNLLVSNVVLTDYRRAMLRNYPPVIVAGKWAETGRLTKNLTPDDWAWKETEFTLGNFARRENLRVAGAVPGNVRYTFPLSIAVSANGTPLGQIVVKNAGDFEQRFALPQALRQADLVTVKLATSAVFVPKTLGINDDAREFSYRFRRIALE